MNDTDLTGSWDTRCWPYKLHLKQNLGGNTPVQWSAIIFRKGMCEYSKVNCFVMFLCKKHKEGIFLHLVVGWWKPSLVKANWNTFVTEVLLQFRSCRNSDFKDFHNEEISKWRKEILFRNSLFYQIYWVIPNTIWDSLSLLLL